MRIHHRLARLEDRLQVGTNKDGTCRYCHGREKELGGRHVVTHDQPWPRNWDGTPHEEPDTTPTPCPKCGRDLNFYVHITHVDMIAKRKAEGGWPDAAREWDRGRLA